MQTGNKHKIEETLNSLNGIQRAEANAYTFEKVMMRLNNERVPVIGIRWSWMAAMLMVVVINGSIAFYTTQKTTTSTVSKENYYTDLSNEMGYMDAYNY